MTTDALNEAVWRMLGWKFNRATRLWTHKARPALGFPADMMEDYADSLDACAELRAGLSEEEQCVYANALAMAFNPSGSWPVIKMLYAITNATAEQHVRAWLAAKGWKEGV